MEDSEAIETRRTLIRQLEERCQEIYEQVFKLNKDQELNNNIISHLQRGIIWLKKLDHPTARRTK
jgi:hypothetical protein